MTWQSVHVCNICNTWKNRRREENVLPSIHKQLLLELRTIKTAVMEQNWTNQCNYAVGYGPAIQVQVIDKEDVISGRL